MIFCPWFSLGEHREGGIILLGSIGSTPEIEFLSPIPALAPNYAVQAPIALGCKRLSAARGLTALSFALSEQ